MTRVIEGLLWARKSTKPPRRSRGNTAAQKAGLRYEKVLGKHLPGALHNPWYEFCDVNGFGKCSPDYVATHRGKVVVIECKLTDTEAAREQILALYAPVLGAVYNAPVRGIIVTRHLTQTTRRNAVVDSLSAALAAPDIPILHWLGTTPP